MPAFTERGGRRQSCNKAICCPAGHCAAMARKGQTSLAQLSKALGFNAKTVATWRKRATVEDMNTGPTEPRSTVLTEAEEAAIIAFRRHALLPLDDCLYTQQPANALRHDLRSQRVRVPVDQAQPSVNQWSGRTHEQNDQGHDFKTVPRRNPRSAANAARGLPLASGSTVHWTVACSLFTYTFARRLETLSGLTPYEYICKIWTSEPDRFILDPIHQMPGLNTWGEGRTLEVHQEISLERTGIGFQTAQQHACLTFRLPSYRSAVAVQTRTPLQRTDIRRVAFSTGFKCEMSNGRIT